MTLKCGLDGSTKKATRIFGFALYRQPWSTCLSRSNYANSSPTGKTTRYSPWHTKRLLSGTRAAGAVRLVSRTDLIGESHVTAISRSAKDRSTSQSVGELRLEVTHFSRWEPQIWRVLSRLIAG